MHSPIIGCPRAGGGRIGKVADNRMRQPDKIAGCKLNDFIMGAAVEADFLFLEDSNASRRGCLKELKTVAMVVINSSCRIDEDVLSRNRESKTGARYTTIYIIRLGRINCSSSTWKNRLIRQWECNKNILMWKNRMIRLAADVFVYKFYRFFYTDPNTFFKSSVTRAAGFSRIFCSSCPIR